MALALSLLVNVRLSNIMFFSNSPDLQLFQEGLLSSANSSMRFYNEDAPLQPPVNMMSLRIQQEANATAGAASIELRNIPEGDDASNSELDTVNVLFGMAGARKAFVDEWEVAMKSILLNAPLDAKLHIHILANKDARDEVSSRIAVKAALVDTLWRQPITITVYDVEKYEAEWTEFIKEHIRENNVIDERVTLGGYYRLLAHKVIPKQYSPVMYMDTDSVIMTNLNDLWKLVDRTKMLQMSLKWLCSGFMIVHLDKFDHFWEGLDSLPNITHGGDQSLVTQYVRAFPDMVGELPEQWDAHLGNGFKQAAHKLIYARREGVGFLHFNGFRPAMQSFFTRGLMHFCTPGCNDVKNHYKFVDTWALADYYVRVTWPWVRYFGHSTTELGNDGYPLKFEIVE